MSSLYVPLGGPSCTVHTTDLKFLLFTLWDFCALTSYYTIFFLLLIESSHGLLAKIFLTISLNKVSISPDQNYISLWNIFPSYQFKRPVLKIFYCYNLHHDKIPIFTLVPIISGGQLPMGLFNYFSSIFTYLLNSIFDLGIITAPTKYHFSPLFSIFSNWSLTCSINMPACAKLFII